jgi:hypothetical protein
MSTPMLNFQKMHLGLDYELRSINFGGKWFMVGKSGKYCIEYPWQDSEVNMFILSTPKGG